jgi:hypothetical protein
MIRRNQEWTIISKVKKCSNPFVSRQLLKRIKAADAVKKLQSNGKLLVILAVFLFITVRYSVIILLVIEKTKVVFNDLTRQGK